MCLSVFSQGDKGTSWYIIWKGSVNVVTHGKVSPPFFPSPLGGNRSLVPALMGSAFGGPKRLITLAFSVSGASPDMGLFHEGWGLGSGAVTKTWLQGLVTTLHEGDDFGQLALVNDAPRAATIILREDNCHFLRVDKQDFNRIIKVLLLGMGRARDMARTVLWRSVGQEEGPESL